MKNERAHQPTREIKAQSISAKSYRIDNDRTWSRIQISRLLSQCSRPSHCLCKVAHKREFLLTSSDWMLWLYPSWILPLCFWYKPSCTQRNASVMTQGTPEDDESFTKVIHSSFEWDEEAQETLLSFTSRPLVCLSVCLEESTVITPLMYDLISGAGAASLRRNNKSHTRPAPVPAMMPGSLPI